MKPQKDIKTTLRYKNMVANLKSRPPYTKEAALLKEIAGGSQWRMDAVMDSISAKDQWGEVDITNIMIQAAMFGRLATTERISEILEYKEKPRVAPPGVQAAFHVATMHGHYRVADFLHSRGAGAQYHSDRAVSAIGAAVAENNRKKTDYLLKTGMHLNYALGMAVALAPKSMVEYLLSKDGANPVDTNTRMIPLETATRHGRQDIALLLLDKVTVLPKENKITDALYYAVQYDQPDVVKAMIAKGAEVTSLITQVAEQRNNQQMLNLLQATPAKPAPGMKP